MDRIGHYKIVSELGRGGMGVVYKAHEESLNRYVAIKVLGEHLEEETEYIERFVREARSAAALSHPNIVQIYSISEEDGHHYFVMEYVHGTSVQRMIQSKGKLPPADAARLILQAAAGLQDAHAQGVVHRDIKPANLMVTDRGLVKIADFGLALMGGVTSRLTATGMLMGTPGYLSPEQCLDQSPDHRTDIYSLGVTFFEMVTGTMPFRADSPLALLKLIVEVEPPDIRELNPEVDDELREIIARMLAKERDVRFSSCTEIIEVLQAWLEARGETIQSVAGVVAAGTAAAVAPPPPPPADGIDVETQPTVAVESGSADRPPPTPPPAPSTSPADAGEAPAPRATAPTTQPPPTRKRSNTALIAVAVVAFLIAVTAVGAVLVVKSGILDAVFGGGETPVAELEQTVDQPAESPDQGETGGMESGAETEELAAEETAVEIAESSPPDTAASESVEFESAPVRVAGSATSQPAGGASTGSSAVGAGANTAGPRPEPKAVAAAPQPAPRIEVVQPTGTVVLAVGERLLAVEAEEYVKGRLERAGVEVIDITSIPGLEGFINTESRPGPEKVRAALRPYARYMVPVRVDYLGERAIYYMGQQDIAYQARVNMGLVDLASGRPVGKPDTIKLEYTQLTAERVVTDKLRAPTTTIVQRLPRE
jgi:serine/threonine-protein kinase